jgi:predicted RNase H-like HicB family nuclease
MNEVAERKLKYALMITWSDEDESFVVEVPELPGCMADGETYEQAVSNAQHVIAEWIEVAQELGRSRDRDQEIGTDIE